MIDDKEQKLKTIGLKIAYYRRINNMRQKDLAEKIGVSPKFLSKIERGKSSTGGSIVMYLNLIDVLGIKIEKLLQKDF